MTLLYDTPKKTDSTDYRNIQNNREHHMIPPIVQHIEQVHCLTRDVLDKNFPVEFRKQFHPRYAEMYIAATLMSRCGFKVTHPSDNGPDFFLPNLECWIEVVTATNGEEGDPNRLLSLEAGKGCKRPTDKIILRLTNALSKKLRITRKYLAEEIIKHDQVIVIFINGGRMSWREPGPIIPEIVQAVLGAGDPAIEINKKTREYRRTVSDTRLNVPKKSKNAHADVPVSTDYFLDRKYDYISAVVYSWANADNPIEKNKWGQDFVTVHNPMAKNPLPDGSFQCGCEYTMEEHATEFSINRIQHEK